MIDEMLTLLERDDEVKAPTRQITGHEDLLSSRDAYIQVMRKSILELYESVTNAIEIRQMQQAEFVAAVYPKPPASRPMIPARRPSSFTRELMETSTKRRKL